MGDLGVDGLVVTRPAKVSAVSLSALISRNLTSRKLPREEERKPIVKHNMLVGSNGELAGTVKQPFILFS